MSEKGPLYYHNQLIRQCHKLVDDFCEENLKEIKPKLLGKLKKLEELQRTTYSGKADKRKPEIVELYMRALYLLVEYSDIFTLCDYERYKEHCHDLLDHLQWLTETRFKNLSPDRQNKNGL